MKKVFIFIAVCIGVLSMLPDTNTSLCEDPILRRIIVENEMNFKENDLVSMQVVEIASDAISGEWHFQVQKTFVGLTLITEYVMTSYDCNSYKLIKQ